MAQYDAEVRRLLKDMQAAAIAECNPAGERQTTEIAAIALQQSAPIVDDETPDSLISLMAQATIVKAWRQHAENRKAQNQ